MPDDVLTRLQAMYHSEQLLSYIVAKLPESALATGWIEQGLVNKGLVGNLLDKKNQEDLVIPVDRFIRLISETQSEIDSGFFIIGTHDKSKHVAIVSNKKNKGIAPKTVIGLNVGNLQTHELLALVTRILTGKNGPAINDPNLDYVEELLSDAANGDVSHLLSLSVNSGKQTPLDWIKKILKTDLNSENVLAQSGDIQEISQSVLIFSRWLLGLDIFAKNKNTIASLLLAQGDKITLYFWDASQKITTFAIFNGVRLYTILWKYVHPLWYRSLIQIKGESSGPTVVIEKVKSTDTRKKFSSDSAVSQSITIVRTLLTELERRISPLVTQLHMLKKRIEKMTSDTRFHSMSENSESAIEELRRIEKETKILEDMSIRLKELEKQLETITSSGHSSSELSSSEIQKIVSKLTTLRTLMDKIDIEMKQLDTRVSDIESLKFKRRTES